MTATDFDSAAGPLPTVARYVVASRTPPRLTETVAVAEKVREALQSLSALVLTRIPLTLTLLTAVWLR